MCYHVAAVVGVCGTWNQHAQLHKLPGISAYILLVTFTHVSIRYSHLRSGSSLATAHDTWELFFPPHINDTHITPTECQVLYIRPKKSDRSLGTTQMMRVGGERGSWLCVKAVSKHNPRRTGWKVLEGGIVGGGFVCIILSASSDIICKIYKHISIHKNKLFAFAKNMVSR